MGNQGIKSKFEEFSSSIKTARDRMGQLRLEAAEVLSEQPVVMEMLEELQTTMAELEVAEEELLQQYEEILATRNAVEHERLRYQDLFDFAPDAYIVTDKAGIITEANRAASGILNIRDRFITGKPLSNYIDERDRKTFRDEMYSLASADVKEIEIRMSPRAGGSFDASLRVGPVRNSKGEVVALRWLIRDITEQKATQERIRKINEELEERVRERTSELQAANEMKEVLLVRAQKAYEQAEAASRSKDEFLAMVSHELRTPLNAVMGWIEILRRGSNEPELVEHALKVIERNARAQAQIVNDILEVSRMMAANLQLEFRPVEISSVIEKAIDTVGPALSAKELQLHKSLDDSIGPVPGDQDRLQQIVQNLLTNSIKFTSKRGRIDVRLAQTDSQAEIIVSDTGRGIAPDFLPHVFDTFSQADNSSRRRYGGLGLGLSIVRHLVELHGGSVRAESPGDGLGSPFIVSLPLARVLQPVFDEFAEPAIDGAVLTSLAHQLEGLWILAVDDEADTLEMLRVVLEQTGAKVTTASSCGEAMEVMEKASESGCPDLLIADIAMPVENGFDLIRKVRSMEPHCGGDIPAIALTAYAGQADRARILAEGYQMHLAKPASVIDLVSCIANLAHRL